MHRVRPIAQDEDRQRRARSIARRTLACMNESVLLDATGRRRSPATTPGFHRGRPPHNKGLRYPADPPAVEEIIAVMRVAGDTHYGLRTRALIVVLWRAGLRISEAPALSESDLDRTRGSVLIRRGKGGKRRQVGMDRWAWDQLEPWLRVRVSLRVGALLCVIDGPTRDAPYARSPGWRPPVLRPAPATTPHAVEMAREGVPLNVIQRQLGHANLGITSVYLQGIDNSEIIETVGARRAPTLPASAGLR